MQFSRPLKVLGCKDKSQHTATVIWMHGLGDTADGWTWAMEAMTKTFPYIKFLLPTAPLMKITIQGGAKCTAWHDIENFQDLVNNKFKYKKESKQLIEQLIHQELQSGIQLNRIVLGGFSQGAAMALYTGLLFAVNEDNNKNSIDFSKQALAGVVSLSGYLCDKNILTSASAYAKQNTNILMCHGSNDMIVRTKYGKMSYMGLKQAGCAKIEWKEYNISMKLNNGHNVVPEEMKKVAKFISDCLPKEYKITNAGNVKGNVNVNTNVDLKRNVNEQKEDNDGQSGGLKKQEINDEIIIACKAVRELVQALTSNKFMCFNAVSCKSQMVQGINYFIKVKVDENRFVHLRVWHKLDNTYVLSAIEFDKNLEDIIEYIQTQESLVG